MRSTFWEKRTEGMNRWKISRDVLELNKTVSEIKMSLDGINNRINSKKKSNELRKYTHGNTEK